MESSISPETTATANVTWVRTIDAKSSRCNLHLLLKKDGELTALHYPVCRMISIPVSLTVGYCRISGSSVCRKIPFQFRKGKGHFTLLCQCFQRVRFCRKTSMLPCTAAAERIKSCPNCCWVYPQVSSADR